MNEQELQDKELESIYDESKESESTCEEPEKIESTYEEPRAHKVSQDSPYSPLYNPYKDKQKKGNTLTAILIIILGVFLVAALVIALSKVVESAISEVSRSTQESSLASKVEELLEGNEEDSKEDTIGDIYAEPDEKTNEFEDMPDSRTEDSYGEYVPKATDEYYVTFADVIRDDLSYTVEKEEYSYFDDDQNVDIYITYPQITGNDVRNLDSINEDIKSAALYYQKNYASHPEKGKVSDCSIEITGYVTYMDEEICSIVLHESCYLPEIVDYIDLYAININMATGQIMDNSTMLDYSEKLGREFRKQSEYQNGTVEGVDMLSDEEIADYLQSSDTGIIFYTPVGLEIGYNYYYGDYPGWVTATFKEYSEYVKKI